MKHAIKALGKDDIVEKVPQTQDTPWISAIVAVPKKHCNVRICVDMLKANQAIRRVRYLIPTVDEICQELSGAKFFLQARSCTVLSSVRVRRKQQIYYDVQYARWIA